MSAFGDGLFDLAFLQSRGQNALPIVAAAPMAWKLRDGLNFRVSCALPHLLPLARAGFPSLTRGFPKKGLIAAKQPVLRVVLRLWGHISLPSPVSGLAYHTIRNAFFQKRFFIQIGLADFIAAKGSVNFHIPLG